MEMNQTWFIATKYDLIREADCIIPLLFLSSRKVLCHKNALDYIKVGFPVPHGGLSRDRLRRIEGHPRARTTGFLRIWKRLKEFDMIELIDENGVGEKAIDKRHMGKELPVVTRSLV